MREMNARRIIVTMTEGTVFRGSINIGNSRRISDYFRRNETMFVLFNATLGDGTEKEVYFLNTNHILWVKPDEHTEASRSDDILEIGIECEADED